MGGRTDKFSINRGNTRSHLFLTHVREGNDGNEMNGMEGTFNIHWRVFVCRQQTRMHSIHRWRNTNSNRPRPQARHHQATTATNSIFISIQFTSSSSTTSYAIVRPPHITHQHNHQHHQHGRVVYSTHHFRCSIAPPLIISSEILSIHKQTDCDDGENRRILTKLIEKFKKS